MSSQSKPRWFYDALAQKELLDGTAKYLHKSNVMRLELTPNSSQVTSSADALPALYIGHILMLISQTRNGEPVSAKQTVAALLAMDDFNNRVSRFPPMTGYTKYPDAVELTEGCDFYMTMTFRDEGKSTFMAGKAWQAAFFDDPTPTDINQGIIAPRPMAVVGATVSHISAMVATLAASTASGDGGVGVVTISAQSGAEYLDDRQRYPFFARTSAGRGYYAIRGLFLYLNSIDVRELAILSPSAGFAHALVQTALREAKNFPKTKVFVTSYTLNDPKTMAKAASLLKDQGTVYHFGISLDRDMVLHLYDKGMMGTRGQRQASTANPTWTLYQDGGYTRLLRIKEDDRLGDIQNALTYASVIGLKTSSKNDQTELYERVFEEAMEEIQNDTHAISYLQWRQVGEGHIYRKNATLFHEESQKFGHGQSTPRHIYDAIMSLGVATCQRLAQSQEEFPTNLFYDQLKQVEMRGGYGDLAFNKTTGSRALEGSEFLLSNTLLVTDPKNASRRILTQKESITFWTNESSIHGFDMNVTSPLLFGTGDSVPPLSIPPANEDMNLVSSGIRTFCWVTAAFVALLSLGCAGWTFLSRNKTRVRASQPPFLILLCIGTLFMAIAIVPMTFQEPMSQELLNAGCMIEPWLISIGFSLSFSALFVKALRINKLFHHARAMRRSRVSAAEVMWIPASVLILNAIILGAWTLVEPLRWSRIPLSTDRYGRTTMSRGTCYSSLAYSPSSQAFGILIVLLNFLAFALSAVQSHRGRDLPSCFNESFYIDVVNTVILESFLLGLPVLAVVESTTSAFMLVSCWILAIVAFTILSTMFGPKITLNNDAQLGLSMATAPTSSHIQPRSSRWSSYAPSKGLGLP